MRKFDLLRNICIIAIVDTGEMYKIEAFGQMWIYKFIVFLKSGGKKSQCTFKPLSPVT